MPVLRAASCQGFFTRSTTLLVITVLVLAACTGPQDSSDLADPSDPAAPAGSTISSDTSGQAEATSQAETTPSRFPPPPVVPDGPVDPQTLALLDDYVDGVAVPDLRLINQMGQAEDPRLLWFLGDILRFSFDQSTYGEATDAAVELSGLDPDVLGEFSWGPLTDHLIAWDLPAFPEYASYKAAVFTNVEPRWQAFFDDTDSLIDWRLTSWGGVLMDDRPLGDSEPCPGGCIPSLDDPALTDATEGDWYPDDAIVFGVQIGEDTVALPKNIMEVHEMVNATIGGRRVAIPYCTLCGAAQVFFTDIEGGGTDQIVMRTSGLLRRSNKVMFDLTTFGVFDTFTGQAISGPLLDQEVTLSQASVVTSSWGDWKAAHPDTTIVAEDGGIGRTYPLDPLRGRDDDGPIFPIGDTDDRLGVQEPVLGIVLPDGTPVAFPVEQAQRVLREGGTVDQAGVTVESDAGGLVATFDGQPVASHQAFWFAWSQFHPDTELWEG